MRLQRGIVGAGLVLALLTGCTDDSEPQAAPSSGPTESESASASPTPTTPPPPTMPPRAAKHTDRGAIAFALHFVEVLNYTATTGDASELRRISTPDCESCLNIISVTESAYANGGYIRGSGWSVDSYSVLAPDEGPQRIVSLKVDTAAQRYRPSTKEPEKLIKRGRGRVTLHLKSTGGSWVVTRMERVGT